MCVKKGINLMMMKKIFLIVLVSNASFSCWGAMNDSLGTALYQKKPVEGQLGLATIFSYARGSGEGHIGAHKFSENYKIDHSALDLRRSRSDYEKPGRGGAKKKDDRFSSHSKPKNKSDSDSAFISENLIIDRENLLEKFTELIKKVVAIESEDGQLLEIQKTLEVLLERLQENYREYEAQQWEDHCKEWLKNYSLYFQGYHELCRQEKADTEVIKKGFHPSFGFNGKGRRNLGRIDI